jgi:hypothetical protein
MLTPFAQYRGHKRCISVWGQISAAYRAIATWRVAAGPAPAGGQPQGLPLQRGLRTWHPERSEGPLSSFNEMLRFTRHDSPFLNTLEVLPK